MRKRRHGEEEIYYIPVSMLHVNKGWSFTVLGSLGTGDNLCEKCADITMPITAVALRTG